MNERHFRIFGIDNDKEFANRFGQKLNALPNNPIFQLGNFICIPDSEKVLAVVHVPKSRNRPHTPSQKELRVFWKRTNTGNEQMTYEEIRESFREVLIKQKEDQIGEVKTRILLILYKKHYSGQPGHPQLTSDVIKEADLSHHDIPFVKGEIAHLVQTGLVQGANYLTAPNYTLSISGMGINEVKKWIMKFNTFLQVESGTDYKQISAIESETAKLGEIWRIFNSNNYLRKKFFENHES